MRHFELGISNFRISDRRTGLAGATREGIRREGREAA
jgi:hypothetical protein